MTADRPVLGIALMLGFCVLAPLGDSLAKILGETLPLGQLVTVRFAVQAAVLVPLCLLSGKQLLPGGRVLRLTVVRTALHIAGIAMMFTALRHLPLADAVAIAFVMPFILLLLGRIVLGEDVGLRRMLACTAGFVGTMLVIQPSFAAVGWHVLWPLGVAVVFALFMLVTRQIAKDADPLALQATSGAIAVVVLLPALLIGHQAGLAPLRYVPPGSGEWAMLLGIGLIGTLAHLLMTWSLRFAPSATLAPMQYLEIPIATLFGWLIFRDLPNPLASVGIAITIGAGVYIVLRERRVARDVIRAGAAQQ